MAQFVARNSYVESSNAALSPEQINELRFKNHMRRLTYVAVFTLFLTVFVFVFSFTVMRIPNPKFRIRAINIEHLAISDDDDEPPSLEMKFGVEVCVKNTNFGPFKFNEGSVRFFYGGVEAGEASVGAEKAGARSTKVMNVSAQVEIDENSSLKEDVESRVLTLTSEGKLHGKVHLMKVIKKEKTAVMRCNIVVNLENKMVDDLKCVV